MKVLYLSNYHELSGYSDAAKGYILALDRVGVDVIPRRIDITGSQGEIPKRILELEKKSTRGATHVIQHSLPHLCQYNGNGGIKNVVMFASESTNFIDSGWSHHINGFDHAIVFNRQQHMAAIESNVNIPISVVPHAFDLDVFQQEYQPLKLPIMPDTFVFLFVGEFNRRKNIGTLLKAFHTEFTSNEPVMLVLKTSVNGMSPEDGAKHINQFAQEVKKGLGLYKSLDYYRPEIVITHQLSQEEMMRLHASSDVFVTATRGEAWCLPAMNSLGLGKPVIAPKFGGLDEYLTSFNGFPVEYSLSPCFGIESPSNVALYTGNEMMAEVDIEYFRQSMRIAFDYKCHYPDILQKKGAAGIDTVYDYSYEVVGTKLKNVLEEI